MKLISFDPLRTLAMPGVRVVKPEHWLREREALQDADWVLFPEYWQVNALHYGLRARIFPSLASYHLGHDKVEMTRAFESRWPAHVPPTVIEAPTPAGQQAALEALGLPLVVKAVRSSQGRGVRLIHSEAELAQWCETQPVLYAQLPLPIDRDLRIVVLGQRIVASYWRIAREGSFLNNVAAGGRLDFSPRRPSLRSAWFAPSPGASALIMGASTSPWWAITPSSSSSIASSASTGCRLWACAWTS